MDFKNKKVIFLGDSITEGYGLNDYNSVYHVRLKKTLCMSMAIDAGISGTRITRLKDSPLTKIRHDMYFESRLEFLPDDYDAIIIFGGTNDFGNVGVKLGNISSSSIYDFFGAYKHLIEALKKKNERAKIILLTPLKRSDMDIKNRYLYTLIDYKNAIEKIAELYNLAVINLYDELILDPLDRSLFQDGLHPTSLGHKRLADFLIDKLEKL